MCSLKGGEMKKTILCLLFLSVLFSTNVFAKEIKMGFIDVLTVFNDYEKTKDYEKEIDNQKKEKEAETKIEEKKEEIIKMQDKIDLLGEKEQDAERERMRKAIIEFRNLESEIISDLKTASDEKMKELLDDINKAVSNYAKKNGFDMILNKGALLYGIEAADITKEITDILNKGYKKK